MPAPNAGALTFEEYRTLVKTPNDLLLIGQTVKNDPPILLTLQPIHEHLHAADMARKSAEHHDRLIDTLLKIKDFEARRADEHEEKARRLFILAKDYGIETKAKVFFDTKKGLTQQPSSVQLPRPPLQQIVQPRPTFRRPAGSPYPHPHPNSGAATLSARSARPPPPPRHQPFRKATKNPLPEHPRCEACNRWGHTKNDCWHRCRICFQVHPAYTEGECPSLPPTYDDYDEEMYDNLDGER